jgi:hypothetical protein
MCFTATGHGIVGELGPVMAAKYCHLCGSRLWGRGWVYQLNGTPEGPTFVVCRKCQESAPRCDVCHMPMAEEHVSLPDGRRVCSRCHQTAVYDHGRAQALFDRVTHIASDRLGLRLNVGTDFSLVDYQHLQRLIKENGPSVQEDAARVVGLFLRKGHKRVIYILSGLPQIVFIHTVAHEWAHVWQGENCPLLHNELVREGFAEWAAHKTLELMGAVKRLQSLIEREGLYGEGLRKMLALEQQGGIPAVLAYCRRSD